MFRKLGFITLLPSFFILACSNKDYKGIEYAEEYNILVEKVKLERGVLVINDEYILNNLEAEKGMENSVPNDNSIWRKNKPVPRISMISAPYQLIKMRNSDSLFLVSHNDTIMAKLIKY